MIDFNYENDFVLENETLYANWLSKVILSENHREGEINYVFCSDDYLLKINQEHLKHDTYTDIISFDYSIGNLINGDIFISTDRVKENSNTYSVTFDNELQRVMVHGILHCCGYKDKTEEDSITMRLKEEEKISMFHVEQ